MIDLYVIKKPRYLCRWWLRTRKVNEEISTQPLLEDYVPLWAKPLDFIWKLIFGKPKLIEGKELINE